MEYQGKIQIQVGQPVKTTDSAISFVTYFVSGVDQKGQFGVRRRYRDFFLLRQKLVERWPGLYIPSISSKKATGNTEEKFVFSRRKALNAFCLKISEKEHIYSSEPFQLFLRSQGSYESAIKSVKPLEYENLSTIYEKNFTQLTLNSSSSQLQISIEADYLFLKSSEKRLQKLRENFRNVVQAKEQYDSHFNSVIGKTMGDYEDKFLLHYIQEDHSKLFLKSNDEFKEKLTDYRNFTKDNLIQDYIELISTQLRQMRAFREAIDNRKKTEEFRDKILQKKKDGFAEIQKLKAGKTTVKSVFSAGSKEQQIKTLEESIEKWETLGEILNNLIILMNASIYTDIEEYKRYRMEEYHSQIRFMNKKQIKQMAVYGDVLGIVLKDQQNVREQFSQIQQK